MTACPDCSRPIGWDNPALQSHNNGEGCECPECVSHCWGGTQCLDVQEENWAEEAP